MQSGTTITPVRLAHAHLFDLLFVVQIWRDVPHLVPGHLHFLINRYLDSKYTHVCMMWASD